MRDAQSLVLTASRSPELTSHFRAIAEMDVGGQPKYGRGDIHALVQATVCRTYAPVLLELSHLVAAAARLGAWELLFWDNAPARASRFAAFFAREAPGLSVADGTLSILYPDGRFSIRFGRMSFLLAMMDMLVSVLGYETVDDGLAALRRKACSASEVSAAARDLAKAYYAWLKPHVPAAQGQRKFRAMISYLSRDKGPAFASREVGDDDILGFWQAHAADPENGQDFKTYVATFRTFLNFLSALDDAERISGLEGAVAIGTGEGEVDVTAGSQQAGSEDAKNPLEALTSGEAAAVKFLGKQEFERLAILFEAGARASRLPASVLRCEVFGKTQARLTQGVRRGLSPAALLALAMDGQDGDYQTVRSFLQALHDGLERILLASLFVLVRGRAPEAVSLVLDLLPGLDVPALAPQIKAMPGSGLAEKFLALMQDEDLAPPSVQALMKSAGDAFKGIARQGFSGQPHEDPALLAAFAEGAPLVVSVRAAIATYLAATKGMESPDLFIRDSETFGAVFARLYGEEGHVAQS